MCVHKCVCVCVCVCLCVRGEGCWGWGGAETYVSLNTKMQRPENRPFEVNDEVVRVPPHCHGFLSTLVSTATRTIPGVVLIQHLTENSCSKNVVAIATKTISRASTRHKEHQHLPQLQQAPDIRTT